MVILLDALDLSITQVALPAIRADLRVPPGWLPWVVNAYVLTYGGLLLFGGRASDLLGRRNALLIGLALFGAGSLLSGLAPNVQMLIAARAVQGMGAALTVPAAVAIIAATFAQGPERDRALGVFAAFASVGFSLGLVLGGLLTSILGWPAIFLIKVPVVAVVAVGAVLAVPSTAPHPATQRSWDVPGAVLGTAGLLLIAFAVTAVSSATIGVWLLVGAAVLGVGACSAFVQVERRAEAPLLPLTLFGNRIVAAGGVASLTVLAAPFGLAFLSTLYLQDVLGWSPLRTGIGLLPGAALSAVVSRWVAPRLIARAGLRWTGTAALFIVAAGFTLLALTQATPSYLTAILPATLVCLGLGMGLAYPAYTVAAVSDVPEELQGVAAGSQNTALQIGGGLGLALVGSVVAAVSGADPSSDEIIHALRIGALTGAALPLLGAVITAVWLTDRHR